MNKKKRSASQKTSRKASKGQSLEETEEILHAQIGRLEEFIAESPFRERKQKIARHNVISAPENTRRNATTKVKRQTRRHIKAARQERHRHLFNFFALFLLLCAMLYWLFQTIL